MSKDSIRPLDMLCDLKNEKVIVILKNNIEITGTLKAFDIHINMVIEGADFEKSGGAISAKRLFIRGDMVLFIIPWIAK